MERLLGEFAAVPPAIGRNIAVSLQTCLQKVARGGGAVFSVIAARNTFVVKRRGLFMAIPLAVTHDAARNNRERHTLSVWVFNPCGT